MKITISGKAGSGKSTVSKLLAEKLNLKHYSTGDFMRQMAAERGLSLLEFSRRAENDPEIDEEIDRRTEELGKKEDNFIFDSRLAFHFIPDSVKIFLDVDIKEAARRIFNDRRKVEKENLGLDETEKNIMKRERSERKRYRLYYGVNPYDLSHYDLIVDTTSIPAGEVAERIARFVQHEEHKL